MKELLNGKGHFHGMMKLQRSINKYLDMIVSEKTRER